MKPRHLMFNVVSCSCDGELETVSNAFLRILTNQRSKFKI